MHPTIATAFRHKQKELAKSLLPWAKREKLLGDGELVGVTLFIVSPKNLGRKRGEHFITDRLTNEDWDKINSLVWPHEYDGVKNGLRARDNRPHEINRLLGFESQVGTYLIYCKARQELNSLFKKANLPYRLRKISSGEVRFIKVTE
jgi:hypothetical protein